MEKTYIGFVEYNGNRGEEFGCYVENTIENLALLNKMEEKYNLLFEDDDWDNRVTFELDGFTEKELDFIEYGSNNTYHNRCTILEDNEAFAKKIDLFVHEQMEGEEAYPIYKGSFQLKNGEYVSFWKED